MAGKRLTKYMNNDVINLCILRFINVHTRTSKGIRAKQVE